MSDNLDSKEIFILAIIFPEVFKAVLGTLEESFEFDAMYAPAMLQRETAEIVLTLINLGVVDYEEGWLKYNEHNAKVFVKEFVSLNTDLSKSTSFRDLAAFLVFQASQK